MPLLPAVRGGVKRPVAPGGGRRCYCGRVPDAVLPGPGVGARRQRAGLAAEAGRFDQLRREVFAAQPPEHSGGFTVEGLLQLGRRADLDHPEYETGVREGRYEAWVIQVDRAFQEQDPHGTPAALLDGEPVDSSTVYDARALGALLRG